MKKIILAVLLFLVLTPVIYFRFIKYAFWQTVSISGIGTFKVPQDWVVTQKGNFVYITDKPIEEEGYIIHLVGLRNNAWYYDFSDYDFFENVVHVGSGRGEFFLTMPTML